MNLIQMHPLYPLALHICQSLSQRGHTAFFAGGCVRDAFLGKQAKDLDIATSATPDEIIQIFPKTIPVGKAFGVMIVVEGGQEFEVATFRQDGGYQDGRRPDSVKFCGPELDAQRRDFTMNALFYDPIQKQVLDFVQGQDAIQKKKIETVGTAANRFQEDHLRILRAIRFSAQLHFEIEEKTFQAIQKMAPLVRSVSVERIQQEFTKMLSAPFFTQTFELILQSQILQNLFPEVSWQKELWPEHFTVALANEELGPWILFWLWYQKSGNLTYLQIEKKIEQFRFSSAEKKCILQAISWLLDFTKYENLSLGEVVSLGFEKGHLCGQKLVVQASNPPERIWKSLQILAQLHYQKPEPYLRAADLDSSLTGEALGACLKKLYHLQLEGIVKSKKEALEFYQQEKRK